MKKFYCKKESPPEEAPILLRLERRHTLMSGERDSSKERRASRANSVGSISGGDGGTTESVSTPVGQSRPPSSEKCMSDDKQSIFSKASTVVITESELSSSWLYNSQRAHIESNNEATLQSQSGAATGSLDNLIPEAHQDDQRPKPTTLGRPRRRSSCCCYMSIALFILLASIGILTAIGGIIYVEIFTSYLSKSNHSTAKQTRDQDRLWIESEIERTLDETVEMEVTAPGIRLPGKLEFNTTVTNETLFLDGETNSSINILNENLFHPLSNKNDSIGGEDFTKIVAPAVDLPDSLRNDGDSKEVIKELSDQDKLDLFLKFNEAVNKHFSINDSQIPRKSPDDPDPSVQSDIDDFVDRELDSNENGSEVDNLNNWPDVKANEPLGTHSDGNSSVFRGQLAYLPIDKVPDNDNNNNEDMHGTELSHSKEDLGHSLESKNDSISQSNIHQEGTETSDDSSAKDSNGDGVPDDSITEHPTENPSSDQKGVPFEFFRRLGFNEESFSAHPALTVEDMNVKFSLAEALKYLRSLDASNRLPTSRQKSEIRRNGFAKITEDVGEERETYLNRLRENLFS